MHLMEREDRGVSIMREARTCVPLTEDAILLPEPRAGVMEAEVGKGGNFTHKRERQMNYLPPF